MGRGRGSGAAERGGGEIKAGRLGRKGKGSLSLFPPTLFPAPPPPPSSPLPLFSCHATTKLCFSIKTIASKGVGHQGSRGERVKWLPIPCRFRVFLPLPLSFFSPVTQLRKCVRVKLLLRRGGRSRKGVGGREGNGSLCLFAFAFFSILPFSFSTCHAASKESYYEN